MIERTVVIGETRNTVSSIMKVSAYLTCFVDRLDSERFAEIEVQGGALLLQHKHGEERHKREVV